MSLQSIKAARTKSTIGAITSSVPLVFIGFGLSYVWNKVNSKVAKNDLSTSDVYNDIDGLVRAALKDLADKIDVSLISGSNWYDYVSILLEIDAMKDLLVKISSLDVFSDAFAQSLSYNVAMLGNLKQLKYWYNLNCGQFLITLHHLSCSAIERGHHAVDACGCGTCGEAGSASVILGKLGNFSLLDTNGKTGEKMRDFIDNGGNSGRFSVYLEHLRKLEFVDAHAVYPTSIYRKSKGLCLSSKDECLIECVMSTTITTSIIIENDVLSLDNKRLGRIYKPFGRCIIIIDERVNDLYKSELDGYFDKWGIETIKLAFSSNECDKHIKSVENILTLLKKNNVHRNEPVLIVGGGVITDLGGFATSLYHRNTPYIMLCTSIVSGIDAGPSPRTCCDGFGYKNIFGCYHPPILTITDRTFFKTLKFGWIRHGIAEIIKMAVVKDIKLFELLEKATTRLIDTKFGTVRAADHDVEDKEFDGICNEIIKKAMKDYVASEYGNLWETHQCRPHAYGHTWSPGFELASGMLHGHAVACGMGFGAYLALRYDYINFDQLIRVLKLINNCQLSLWHDSMDNWELIWESQTKMIEKRGGNLCAPVPKGEIGQCGYINKLSKDDLVKYLNEYKCLVTNNNNKTLNGVNGLNGDKSVSMIKFDRNGYGVEPHCVDVGLECPSKVETMANKYEKEIEMLKLENSKLRQQMKLSN